MNCTHGCVCGVGKIRSAWKTLSLGGLRLNASTIFRPRSSLLCPSSFFSLSHSFHFHGFSERKISLPLSRTEVCLLDSRKWAIFRAFHCLGEKRKKSFAVRCETWVKCTPLVNVAWNALRMLLNHLMLNMPSKKCVNQCKFTRLGNFKRKHSNYCTLWLSA